MKRSKMTLLSKLSLGIFSWFILSIVQASSPLWTFTPLTPTAIDILPTETATIQYLVTNKSKKPHTLVMSPITGISQLTSTGNCPNPFTLNVHQSCTLTLEVTGSAMQKDVIDGPILCQNGAGALQCYRPSHGQKLQVIRKTDISITAPIQANRVINVGSTTPLTITVTLNPNNLINDYNVQATLPVSWINVVQDASNCVTIAPGESCTLKFTSTTPYEPDQITISGKNTKNLANTFLAFRQEGGLVFSVNSGVVKVSDEENIDPTTLMWWNEVYNAPSMATSLIDGAFNTPIIITAFGNPHNYAAALCADSLVEGFNDWVLPAICELGRFTGSGTDAGCRSVNQNLYTTLQLNGFGNFDNSPYWSSTFSPTTNAWAQNFNPNDGTMFAGGVNNRRFVRCIRSFNF